MRTQAGSSMIQLVATPNTRVRQNGAASPTVVSLTLLPDERLLLTVVEAARRLEISRSRFYELLASGEIDSIHVGRLRRIPADALSDYVERRRSVNPYPAA